MEIIVDGKKEEESKKNEKEGKSKDKDKEKADESTAGNNNTDDNTEVTYHNHGSIDNFFSDTGTTGKDYTDLYVAHYPKDKYTVGIVVTDKDDKKTLEKINEYKEKLVKEDSEYYAGSVVKEVNGCIIIALSNNGSKLSEQSIGYIESIQEILGVTTE